MEEMSENIKLYFKNIDKDLKHCLEIATKARKQGKDPEEKVDIPLAENMADRVEGLISNAAPELTNTNMAKRILELEKKYPSQSWEIALIIAEEVAKEKFCKFKDKRLAIEVGIRVGMAYSTAGIVAAPLEGFVEAHINKRSDGGDYLSIFYAGPIRGAGGTAAALSVIIADYVRVKMGLGKYDPTEKEIKRYVREIYDYHERVTNLQYLPSEQEVEFMVKNLPVEVNGDPTEKLEVSNYKDIPRIETNLIRGGMCLVVAEGLTQKAPKLWKRLSKWSKEFDLDWDFLEGFLELQKQIKAKKESKEESKEKISPNYTYIADLVAGRPVFSYPLRDGGFRLRYGRTRFSGLSCAAVNPGTMWLLNNYVAVGTQLKVERPGKAASITCCDEIDGPIIKLKNGTVLAINNEEEAKKNKKEIEKILFLGDILFNYGDFSENNHVLVPPGYCPEWWVLEIEKTTVEMFGNLDTDKLAEFTGLDVEIFDEIFKNPNKAKISFESSKIISEKLNLPLHPNYTYFWRLIKKEDLFTLLNNIEKSKVVIEENLIKKSVFKIDYKFKLILEKLGIPHTLVNNEFIVLGAKATKTLLFSLGVSTDDSINKKKEELNKFDNESIIQIVSSLSGVKIKDKAGTFIGARMGRPEKAKMRKLVGSPHVLFPVGEEGGRLRSFQSAVEKNKIKADFPIFYCNKCKKETIFHSCEVCKEKAKKMFYCKSRDDMGRECGITEKEECPKHGKAYSYRNKEIDIGHFFDLAIKNLDLKIYPDVIKGVRGTINKDHIPENLTKGVLRAKWGICVNKDGTTRYDMTELPLTHFKPSEIGTSVERLKELGYEKDAYGKDLTEPDQIVEIKPQDLVLPSNEDALEDSADKVLFKVAGFIDELLEKFYNLKPYYNFKTARDLVGHLVIGLAPHISAGTVGRIIGFSKTQGCFAHPLFHAALRRDCFSYGSFIPLKIGKYWEIKQIGEVVDQLNPIDVIDDFGTKEIKVKNFKTLGVKEEICPVNVNNFTKHSPQNMILIKTASGKKIKTTYNHKHILFNNKIVEANQLKLKDKLKLPYKNKIPKNNIKEINLINELKNEDWAMVSGLKIYPEIKNYAMKFFKKKDYYNFFRRDSYPISFINKIKDKIKLDYSKLRVSAKRDHVKIPAILKITDDFLYLIGLYVAEGYSRKVPGRLYQVYITAQEKELRDFIKKEMKNKFNLVPSENEIDRVTYSSKVLYFIITNVLKCGSSAYEKRIPSLFLNLPNKNLGSLISGYLDGDGSLSKSDNRLTFDTVSEGLLRDVDFIFSQFGVFVKNYEYTSFPGSKVREFYIRKNKEIPKFKVTKGIIQSVFMKKLKNYVHFKLTRKQKIFEYLLLKKPIKIKQVFDENYIYDEIVAIELLDEEPSYCLNVPGNKVVVNNILTKQCDGDENCVMLVMDAFLNFSRQFLPDRRGSRTMDSPLVLTHKLVPAEVDDMVHGMDIVWKYPLQFYEAAEQYQYPWEVKIDQIKHKLNTLKQYEGVGFTHNMSSINKGVLISAYKTLPTMEDKLKGQMDLAVKINAVEESDVATAVIEKHFLKDIRGNLRKFSQQQFRCVGCNEKFRRPPLVGKCTKCNGKIIFTIHEGSVGKYLGPSISLAEKYNVSTYLKQTLEITKRNFEGVFGKDPDKQASLGDWFG